MVFKALFLAHAPDADAEKHRCVIETPKYYKLFVVVVRDQEQAVEVCKKIVEEEGVQSILLCPGFTHRAVAEYEEDKVKREFDGKKPFNEVLAEFILFSF